MLSLCDEINSMFSDYQINKIVLYEEIELYEVLFVKYETSIEVRRLNNISTLRFLLARSETLIFQVVRN